MVVLAVLLTAAVWGLRAMTPHPDWAIAGGYGNVGMADLHDRGVRSVMVEMAWREANPGPGVFDDAYLDATEQQVRSYRKTGMTVLLSYGLHEAPAWLLDLPGGRFVDQDGAAYTAEPVPDLVFTRTLRTHAQAYTDRVLTRLGPLVSMVRLGGGHFGELGYPPTDSRERPRRYWAFGPQAFADAPDPTWRPCSPSPTGQASRFYDYYLRALQNYQAWQITSVRRTYDGPVAMLYPSIGFTPQQRQTAVARNLCGDTQAERFGAIGGGWDHTGQISALPRKSVTVWCTWTDNTVAADRLAELARRNGLPIAGENSGFDDAQRMRVALANARRLHFSVFLWIRADQAYCRCNGWASIDDYERGIS
jgi:hypothetical protein